MINEWEDILIVVLKLADQKIEKDIRKGAIIFFKIVAEKLTG